MPKSTAPGQPAARQRLLRAADTLFYGEGIRHVPVDRVIAEAGVSRATFYRQFRSKEDLVVAYVQARDVGIREQFEHAISTTSAPGPLLEAVAGEFANEICLPGFRGCPFINAAAEYPDPDHPVHRAVATHRAWFRGALLKVAEALGASDANELAETLVTLRDGAMVRGYLDGSEIARDTLLRAVAQILAPRR